MGRPRTRLLLNVGNLLELAGAACLVYGVYRLAGVGWALIAGAVVLILAAELLFGDDLVWRIPLPLRPRPGRWWAERRDYAARRARGRHVKRAVRRLAREERAQAAQR